MILISSSEKETFDAGFALGSMLKGGQIVTLSVELGAGKTVFTKGIARGLGVTDEVVSPTFTLMNEYDGKDLKLYHYDAYRLNNSEEAIGAGLTEYFGTREGVCVIEWYENISAALMRYKKIRVNISYENGEKRKIEIVDE